MDGDGRGGAALSMRAVTGKPIRFVGLGEKMDALETFEPGRIAGGQVLLKDNAGTRDLLALSEQDMEHVRGNQISMIFQDPMTSLNPVQQVDEHLTEAIRVHEPQTKKDKALGRAQRLIERLGIERSHLYRKMRALGIRGE